MEDKVEIDVADAEEMLKKARVHLDRDEARKARDLSVRAENVVRDRLALAHSAQKALDFADRSVTKARKARVDTKKAEDLLMRARRAMRNNEFYDAISLSEKAVAATTIQPLPGKEITVKTVFARVEQRVLYKVLLRNNLAQTIDGIMVIPDTSNSVFVPYPESAVVDLGPNGEETVMFELTPADEDAYALEDFIPGRDVSVSTVLTERDDGLIFRIKVRNETERPMETLHMEPFVPEGHVSAPSEAFVNLSPYGSRSIEFVLRPESRSRADVELECAQCTGHSSWTGTSRGRYAPGATRRSTSATHCPHDLVHRHRNRRSQRTRWIRSLERKVRVTFHQRAGGGPRRRSRAVKSPKHQGPRVRSALERGVSWSEAGRESSRNRSVQGAKEMERYDQGDIRG
ncbi:MAG: hypothetical protein L0Z54_03015, partial [Thermoplasmata archaeon]|nr:hypothetical protein [Thermoplasmata archaeon]